MLAHRCVGDFSRNDDVFLAPWCAIPSWGTLLRSLARAFPSTASVQSNQCPRAGWNITGFLARAEQLSREFKPSSLSSATGETSAFPHPWVPDYGLGAVESMPRSRMELCEFLAQLNNSAGNLNRFPLFSEPWSNVTWTPGSVTVRRVQSPSVGERIN